MEIRLRELSKEIEGELLLLCPLQRRQAFADFRDMWGDADAVAGFRGQKRQGTLEIKRFRCARPGHELLIARRGGGAEILRRVGRGFGMYDGRSVRGRVWGDEQEKSNKSG